MPTVSDSLAITILLLLAEIAIFVFCLFRVRKPVDPLRPRIVPYNLIMIFLAVAIFATLAHAISLVTGHQLTPRRGKGMR
ncbi:MAG: hypothetical protein AB7E79_17200 [Rhodospirillaceae bacterium]